MKKLTINPIKKINGNIFIPGSKSISNRVLLLSSLCFNKKTKLINLLNCEDVNNMISILIKLGVKINKTSDISNSYNIYGFKNLNNINFNNEEIILDSGNAGTVFRSILSLISICKNKNIILTGNNRMKERPIEHLVNALNQGNAKINYINNNKYPPLRIFGGYSGGDIYLDCSISSQFLSSLLMISPLCIKNSNIYILKNTLVSKPYIRITLKLMKKFGINVINNNYNSFHIKGNQNYTSPKKFIIESDASSASYFLAASVINTNSKINVIGIGKKTIQGDIKFAKILQNLGANIKINDFFIESSNNIGRLKSININANDIPDSAMTLLIVALFTNYNKKSTIRNIYNWRVKETDRLSAMSNELKKIGVLVKEGNDYISILPPKNIKYSLINTYNDHRIAMCFSLIPFLGKKITIINPNCVNKTFPEYFKILYKFSTF